MKTTKPKLNPQVYLDAAERVERELDSAYAFACLAIKFSSKDWELHEQNPKERYIFEDIFDCKSWTFNHKLSIYGELGKYNLKQIRVLALCLMAQIARHGDY